MILFCVVHRNPTAVDSAPNFSVGEGFGFQNLYLGAVVQVAHDGIIGTGAAADIQRRADIDLTGIETQVGDRVSFFGHTPTALSALAEHAGTIPYELLCAISPRVPRTYYEEKRGLKK